MKPLNTTFLRFGLVILFASMILAACGEAQPSPTAVPSPTIAATATIAPTAIPPSPTPVPIPAKFILGDANNPWGEIARYEEAAGDNLKEIKLNAKLKQELSGWLQDAPKLATNGALNSGKLKSSFTIKLLPVTVAKLFSGDFRLVDIKANVNVIFNNITSASPWSLSSILSPNTIFQLASVLVSSPYMASINQQYEQINANLETIKSFLQQQEYGKITGNMEYLNFMQATLNEQKLSELDLANLRTQLELIDRETGQAMKFAKLQMDTAHNSFAGVSLNKSFGVFRNESAVDDLIRASDEFKIHSDNYYVALSVKTLASQILCAIPASRDLAIKRLEDSQVKLQNWQDSQFSFYEMVGNRIPEMNGLLSDKKKPNSLIDAANRNREWANTGLAALDKVLTDNLQKVKEQQQLSTAPLTIVVELDEQAKIAKASQLGKT